MNGYTVTDVQLPCRYDEQGRMLCDCFSCAGAPRVEVEPGIWVCVAARRAEQEASAAIGRFLRSRSDYYFLTGADQ